MDPRLISWARAVKARSAQSSARAAPRVPPLWLLTDAERLADPRALAARLPKGLCGVLLRHDQAADRASLGRALGRLCRQRRNLLVVAGDPKLAFALGAGLHLRGGRARIGPRRRAWPILTASVHHRAEAIAAQRAGAAAMVVSPLFPSASHPGAPPLGLLRALALSSKCHGVCLVLGGITGANLRRVPAARFAGFGAISAFLDICPSAAGEG